MLDTDRFTIYYGWSCGFIVAALLPSGKAESVIFKLGCSTGFAGKGVGSSVADNSGLEMPDLCMVVFAGSFLFALPSSLFVVTLFVLLPSASFTMGIGVWGLVAGFLPPLLFALGSFVQSEKREKGREWLENG